MRLLVLDHYFDQDIAALRAEAGPDVEMRTISFDLLRYEALRVFPTEVATGLEAYRPSRARARAAEVVARARRAARGAVLESGVRRLRLALRRLLLRAGRARGVPPAGGAVPRGPEGDDDLAADDGDPTPSGSASTRRLIADRMTVCSERHRQFWLRIGAIRRPSGHRPAAVRLLRRPRARTRPTPATAGAGRSSCSSPTRSTPTTRATATGSRSGRSSTARRRQGSASWPSEAGAS